MRFSDALARGAAHDRCTPVAIGPDDIAFLQYTGGTTGVSKGAMLIHRNIVANMLQAEAWIRPALAKPAASEVIIVCALPLYHIFSLTANCLVFMRVAAHNVLITNPRDMPGFVKELREAPFTQLPGVNTLFNALLNHPDFAQARLQPRCKVCARRRHGGAAARSPSAGRQVTGCPIVEGYGLSETSPVGDLPTRSTAPSYTGTIGLPMPSTEIAHPATTTAASAARASRARSAIRGPQVMAGYWQRPDETAKVMTADGFFAAGDIGVMDERGYFKIVDRKKDMILVSRLQRVSERGRGRRRRRIRACSKCAAVGVPDEQAGRGGQAVRRAGRTRRSRPRQLIEYCHEQPHRLQAARRRRVPRRRCRRRNVGKILRRELRDEKQPA